MNRRIVAAVSLALLVGVGSCAKNPVTGKSELSLVSSGQEMQLGLEGYPAVLAEYGKYDDAALGAYVDSVGQRVAHVSHLPDLKWHFTLVDDSAVNAFAMPGGYIYVTRGILAYLGSEAQLAGVLGHEVGHVTHRHTAEAMTRQQIYGLGFGVLQVAVPSLRPYSGAGQQALGLLFLSYSRGAETQADELGVEYATKAGYDPREIPATYATLKRVSAAAGASIPVYMSTHPDPGQREVTTRQLATTAAAGKTGLEISQRKYLHHLEGLVFGTDPRQGYFEKQTFYQPETNFQIEFPAGWKTQNSRATVAAGGPDQQAMMQLSQTDGGGQAPDAYVHSLLSAGKLTSAQGNSEKIGGFDSWVGRIVTPGDNGPVTLAAAFIKGEGKNLFQVLGESATPGDANEQAILTSLRTFRPIADEAHKNVHPARVHLAPAPSAGTLTALLPKLGGTGASVDEQAIVNGVEADEQLQAGKTLKVVRPGAAK